MPKTLTQREAQSYVDKQQIQLKLSQAINTAVSELAQDGVARIASILGHQESTRLLERIASLERENERLRSMLGMGSAQHGKALKCSIATLSTGERSGSPNVIKLRLGARPSMQRQASFATTVGAGAPQRLSRRPSQTIKLEDGTESNFASPRL